ncbi:glycosyltransferase family 4 protein [Blastococcus haudaquaticus]|uniref:Glycosyltransferase involved in cell wall bisynthesis n=1 Tax=Blastococcus haudaquaticus TaxID=1938745 RepID=A0A286GDZ9_9ACTN|nr:glycosyltransferase family 4 protein [Blastococcus haudaquaticus]SOD93755.1 Glycosyltransferase involved in cell wall bisynthesis [Blastococcus haudaquaticus]
MRILMVSPYPPKRDGIATYAAQAVAHLERQGHQVEVLSPEPSAAHHHLDFQAGPRFGAALARRVRAYDKIVLQWHPAFFYRSSDPTHRAAVDAALAVAFKIAPQVEVWVHEFEYEDARGGGVRAQASRLLFRSATALFFHSETERDRFLEVVPVDPAMAHLAQHGEAFVRRSAATREEARASLGIDPDSTVFLCIGFIQEHKGFDRAVHAFSGLAAHGARLDIVGSTRLDEPDFVAYLNELDRLCAATPGASLHAGYISDELFDRWIVASDAVVLPYRHIWSSGVMERAALYERPVIATRVGGLAEQAGDRLVTLVDDDAGLAAAMRQVLGVDDSAAEERAWNLDGDDLFTAVQSQVRERARLVRGGEVAFAGATPGAAVARETAPTPGTATLPVRRLPPFSRPPATSLRPGVSQLKRAVRRLISWEVDPVVHHELLLQQAVVASLDTLEQRLAAVEGAVRPGTGGNGAGAPAPADPSSDRGSTA